MTDFLETGLDPGTNWTPFLTGIWEGISGQGIKVHENLSFALFLSTLLHSMGKIGHPAETGHKTVFYANVIKWKHLLDYLNEMRHK